jgi:hypothetical protein
MVPDGKDSGERAGGSDRDQSSVQREQYLGLRLHRLCLRDVATRRLDDSGHSTGHRPLRLGAPMTEPYPDYSDREVYGEEIKFTPPAADTIGQQFIAMLTSIEQYIRYGRPIATPQEKKEAK